MSSCLPLTIAFLLACAQAYEDPTDTYVRIAGDENAVITGELDKPLVIRCLAYGYPIPKVFWTRNNRMLPFNDAVYETRGNSLLIKSLGIDTLGQYACVAYNEIGGAASWEVLVRAYGREGLSIKHDYLVARTSTTTTRRIPLPTILETTSTSTTTTTTERPIFYTDVCKLPDVKGPCDADHVRWYYNSTREQCLRFRYGGCLGNANNFDSRELCQTKCEPDKTTDYPKPLTCKESLFGCCPDGVSAAQGDSEEGCPLTPCEETLFGCCQSDNKTAALGNDDEGCPAPCTVSEFGCWADEETEAYGENGKGYPEYQSTTEETTSEGTSTIESSTSEGSTSEGSTSKGSTSEGSISESTSEGISYSKESSTLPEGYVGSKFGCCYDNDTISYNNIIESTTEETTSEGTSTSESSNSEGSTSKGSTLPERCVGSKFGCCYDNDTEASGPDMQGCPCTATKFGCCPDDVSPAQGKNNKGCQGACRNSKYGCCSDDQTPAHGPDFEGCCLLTAFGCCPDNRKAAEGPHLEGCRCQHAQHGCCPDNVTAARGPNNEGCGCQYTEFGCCPDRHTVASGPNFEGCSCLTYQFGCCPDGVTIATSPDQQSCRCEYSTYGCCGDAKSPATGPNGAGCNCSTSKYGCCPDGQTEAGGSQFLGCANVPENKQAVCSLSSHRGPCSNYTVVYFYDRSLGGCSRFWYGGCEGNGNKFTTKEDCEDICVRPAPKDVCKLPDVKGPCDENHVRWYYNSTREQCLPFRYGGCLGNANNFDSRGLCQTKCEPDKTTDTCNLPIEQGLCAGNFSRWGYNSELRACEQFIWGGCAGNTNQFNTEAACQLRCDTHNVVCSKQQEAGNCGNKVALWAFSQPEDRCVPFYYTGCMVPDKCTLPAETGDCSDYRSKWFYDTRIQRCRQFFYGGCSGNKNNFDTENECSNECTEPVTTTTTSTTIRPTQPQPQTEPLPQPEPEPDTDEEDRSFCFLEIDAGALCSFAPVATLYAYSSTLGKCVTFQHNGCGGNQNIFPNEELCNYFCHPVQDICRLPMMTGTCEDSLMNWFYDPVDDSCSQFTYSGCGGNGNRFESREACESRCGTGPAVEPVTQKPTIPVNTTTTVAIDIRFAEQIPPECKASTVLEECRSAGEVWYFNPRQSECVSHVNPESGRSCRYTATFQSQEACERHCGAFQGIDLCSLVPDQGSCGSYIEQWYYDADHGDCSQFVYTGCSGNDNRFDTREDCESRCKLAVTTTTTVAPVVHPEEQYECQTPSSLAPCGYNITVFYYDSNSKSCLPSEFGGCRHPNSYHSEEECERQCGAFRGEVDVCQAQLDPGPCGNPVNKYYFDSLTGRCQPFTYGGCAGGPNRFSTINECEEICGDSILGTNEVGCESYERLCASLTCDEIVRSSAPGGCESCACADSTSQCQELNEECERILCPYDVRKLQENGCERCICDENPCLRNNCKEYQWCEVLALADPVTRETRYSYLCQGSEDTPVRITGEENAVITGELDKPMVITCLAYGYPIPKVFWIRDNRMVPFNDAVYEIRGSSILIRNLGIDTLGQYTCIAYNEIGGAASWVVLVRAYRPEGLSIEHDYLVARSSINTTRRIPLTTTLESTSTTTTTTATEQLAYFIVPVSVHMATTYTTLNIGAKLRLACEVDGYPEPTVYWTKDGQRLVPDERTSITDNAVSQLVISRVTMGDSGLYRCHADNEYSSDLDNAQINVQSQLMVPVNCVNNEQFANCDLIVRRKFCHHKYYSKFCCKSCVEAGQLDPPVAEAQADQPYRKK